MRLSNAVVTSTSSECDPPTISRSARCTTSLSAMIERASLPADLMITAKTDDGVIMGVAHKTQPVHGVQFHPESIASEHGHALLKNFLQFARVHETAHA